MSFFLGTIEVIAVCFLLQVIGWSGLLISVCSVIDSDVEVGGILWGIGAGDGSSINCSFLTVYRNLFILNYWLKLNNPFYLNSILYVVFLF
jgi:hypothetical protein